MTGASRSRANASWWDTGSAPSRMRCFTTIAIRCSPSTWGGRRRPTCTGGGRDGSRPALPLLEPEASASVVLGVGERLGGVHDQPVARVVGDQRELAEMQRPELLAHLPECVDAVRI